MSGIPPPDCSKLAQNPKNVNDVTIFRHDANVNFFDVILFLLSGLATGQSVMSISPLVLELWQFSFIRHWPEIRKSEIPPSEFCLISGHWDELWIPNLPPLTQIRVQQHSAKILAKRSSCKNAAVTAETKNTSPLKLYYGTCKRELNSRFYNHTKCDETEL